MKIQCIQWYNWVGFSMHAPLPSDQENLKVCEKQKNSPPAFDARPEILKHCVNASASLRHCVYVYWRQAISMIKKYVWKSNWNYLSVFMRWGIWGEALEKLLTNQFLPLSKNQLSMRTFHDCATPSKNSVSHWILWFHQVLNFTLSELVKMKSTKYQWQ